MRLLMRLWMPSARCAARAGGGAGDPAGRAAWVARLLAAAFALSGTVAGAAQERAEARVDADRIGIEDTLVLTLSVPDGGARLEIPAMDDFEVLGTGRTFNTSIVNGALEQRLDWNLTLAPRRTGTLEIPSLEIPGFDPTEPITVTVVDGTLAPRSRRPRPSPFSLFPDDPFDPFDPFGTRDRLRRRDRQPVAIGPEDVFVRAEVLNRDAAAGVDPPTAGVAVGGQAVVLYRAWSRLPVTAAGAADAARPEGFWIEEIDLPDVPWQERGLDRRALAARRALPGPRRETRTVDGVDYETWPLLARAVFPTGAGERVLPGPRFEILVGTGRSGFFGPEESVVVREGPEVVVRAAALPAAGRPAGWSGAVGDYRLEAELLRGGEALAVGVAEAGEALTLRVRLEGDGNLSAVETPALSEAAEFRRAFRVFDPASATESGLSGSDGDFRFGGRRTWDFPLVPEAGGVRRIPPVVLDVFNPASRAWERLATDPIRVEVAGAAVTRAPASGPASAERLNEDIRYLNPVGLAAPTEPRAPRAWFWLALAAPVFWNAGVFWFLRRRAFRARHARRFRARAAAQVARRRLRRIRTDADDAPQAMANVLAGYVADRLSLSARGLTPESVERSLREAGADPAAARRLAEVLSRAESAAYARAGSVAPSLEPRAAEALVADIDRALADRGLGA